MGHGNTERQNEGLGYRPECDEVKVRSGGKGAEGVRARCGVDVRRKTRRFQGADVIGGTAPLRPLGSPQRFPMRRAGREACRT